MWILYNFAKRLFFKTSVFSPFLTGVLATVLFLFIRAFTKTKTKTRPTDFPPGTTSLLEFLTKFRRFFLASNINDLPYVRTFSGDYGKILGISSVIAGFRGVFISDTGSLKEAFKNPAMLGRAPFQIAQMFQDGKYRGIVVSSGEVWSEIRKFTVSQLKSYGASHKSLEPLISREADELVAQIRGKLNRPFPSLHLFHFPTLNILWTLISSGRFEKDDPQAIAQAHRLLHCIDTGFAAWAPLAVLFIFPKVGEILLKIFGIKNPAIDFHNEFLQFTSKFVEQRKAEFYRGIQHDDFTHAFMAKIESTTNVKSQFYGQLGYENLQETIRDLFIASTDSSGTTLSWALLFLALHPDKQAKLQEEIDTVLQGRIPTLEDKPRMTYLEAVVNETLRKSSFAALGIAHATTEDTTLGKYALAKGTTVVSNIYAIHHCEETWGDPYVFRPERFLSEDESTLVKHEAFIPFGTGKRMCIGEQVARANIYIFLTKIFREFSVQICTEGASKPRSKYQMMGAKLGLGLVPESYSVIFMERKSCTS